MTRFVTLSLFAALGLGAAVAVANAPTPELDIQDRATDVADEAPKAKPSPKGKAAPKGKDAPKAKPSPKGKDAPKAGGGDVWKANKCVSCHGADGKGQTKMGKKKGAPDMTSAEWQKKVTDERINEVILKGYKTEKDGKKFSHRKAKNAGDADALLKVIRGFGG